MLLEYLMTSALFALQESTRVVLPTLVVIIVLMEHMHLEYPIQFALYVMLEHTLMAMASLYAASVHQEHMLQRYPIECVPIVQKEHIKQVLVPPLLQIVKTVPQELTSQVKAFQCAVPVFMVNTKRVLQQ